jgi:hypothetical protein
MHAVFKDFTIRLLACCTLSGCLPPIWAQKGFLFIGLWVYIKEVYKEGVSLYPSAIFIPVAFPVILFITDMLCVYFYSDVITTLIIDEFVDRKTSQNFLVCCCWRRLSGLLNVESSQMCIQLRTAIVLQNFSYVCFSSFDLIVNKTILQISCSVLSSLLVSGSTLTWWGGLSTPVILRAIPAVI